MMTYHRHMTITGRRWLREKIASAPACTFCEEPLMIGNPQFCRAEKCRELASTASDPLAKKTYAFMGENWSELAYEIEMAKATLMALNMSASPNGPSAPEPAEITKQH